MHWSSVFACLFFTTAFCNVDSGPATVIALYLTRKFGIDAGLSQVLIAPGCPAPCEFKDFIQYVSPRNPKKAKPKYGVLDWSKLTDAALADMKSAVGALQAIKYTGNTLDERLFGTPKGEEQHYRDLTQRVKTSISLTQAMLQGKGKDPKGGSFGLLMDYWQAVADLRRQNSAKFMVTKLEKDFEDKFKRSLEAARGSTISHSPVVSYEPLDVPGTIRVATNMEGLDATEVESFINDFVENYNNDTHGKSHANAVEDTQNMVNCYR